MNCEMKPLSPEEAESIEEKLDAFYDSIVPPEARASIEDHVFKITDGKGNIIAGCIARINSWDILRIDTLWVYERYRRSGLGTLLMRAAERAGKERGCYASTVGTGDFQARGFYEKNGYVLCGTIEDSPKGHESYALMKRLDRAPLETALRKACAKPNYEVIPGNEEDAGFINDKLDEYNASYVSYDPDKTVNLSKKIADDEGNLMAGIIAKINGESTAQVYVLWVEEAYHGRGLGSDLLRDTEREAKEKGCNRILLDVLDCQARFFETCGYTACVTFRDIPRGHCWYSMKKLL